MSRRWLLAAALIALALVASSAALVEAASDPGIDPGPPSANAGMGIDGLILAPDIRHGNQPMLFERYAALDYTPLNVDPGSALISVGTTGPPQEAANIVMNYVASAMAAVLVEGGVLMVRLVEWTFSLDLVTAAGGPVARVVDALHRQFYDRLQGLILVGLGGALIYLILVGRLLRAVVAIVWAVAALALGAVLMASPVEYIGNANEFTNQASQWALEAIGSADSRQDGTSSQGPAASAELRSFADRVWYVWVYVPWTELEFGQPDPKVPGSARQLGVELLDKKAGHPSSFDSDFQAMPQPVKDWYNGDRGIDRAMNGALAVVVLFAAGLLLLGLTFTIFAASLAVVALALAMPLFLLLAPIPGHGQLMFLKWLELILGAFLLKVMLSLFLGLVMVLAGVLATFTSPFGWGLSALLQLVLLWLAWQHRRTFVSIGRKVAHPQLSAPAPARQLSQPAREADRRLALAHRRAMAPLRQSGGIASSRPLAEGQKGSRALAQGSTQGAARGATGAAARSAGTAGSAGAGSAGAGTAGAATAGAATGGLVLAGLAAIRVAQGGVRLYEHARHHTLAPAGHFLGGSSSSVRPAARHREELGLPTLAWRQYRTGRNRPRLPAPQTPSSGQPTTKRGRNRATPIHAGPAPSQVRLIKPEEEADRK